MCVQVSFDQLGVFGGVKNKRIGITGLGPAGLLATQMASAYGASEVVAFDPLPERRAFAQQLGLECALPPDDGAFAAARFADGALDLRIDCTASHRRGGLALVGYENHNLGAGQRALQLIAAGKLDLEPLATCALPFARYTEGLEMLRRKEATKIRFLPWADCASAIIQRTAPETGCRSA